MKKDTNMTQFIRRFTQEEMQSSGNAMSDVKRQFPLIKVKRILLEGTFPFFDKDFLVTIGDQQAVVREYDMGQGEHFYTPAVSTDTLAFIEKAYKKLSI